ncbi:MAG: hypothetical protein K9K38_09900 [Rhodoferax sp.]|nr:hypothetical protein [Rhodoferax sp.]
MNTYFFGFEGHHHVGDSATHPIDPGAIQSDVAIRFCPLASAGRGLG